MAYALAKKYWGKDIISNEVREMIKLSFETMKLNRIEARSKIENIGSKKVMPKNGMKFEGILRQQYYKEQA